MSKHPRGAFRRYRKADSESIAIMFRNLIGEEMPPSAKVLFHKLWHHANAYSGECNPGHRLIADEAHIWIGGIQRWCKELTEAGYLEVVKGGIKKGGRLYEVNHYILKLGNALDAKPIWEEVDGGSDSFGNPHAGVNENHYAHKDDGIHRRPVLENDSDASLDSLTELIPPVRGGIKKGEEGACAPLPPGPSPLEAEGPGSRGARKTTRNRGDNQRESRQAPVSDLDAGWGGE